MISFRLTATPCARIGMQSVRVPERISRPSSDTRPKRDLPPGIVIELMSKPSVS